MWSLEQLLAKRSHHVIVTITCNPLAWPITLMIVLTVAQTVAWCNQTCNRLRRQLHRLNGVLLVCVKDMENTIRNTLNEIYFGKTKDVVNSLRSVIPATEQKQRETLMTDLTVALKGLNRGRPAEWPGDRLASWLRPTQGDHLTERSGSVREFDGCCRIDQNSKDFADC